MKKCQHKKHMYSFYWHMNDNQPTLSYISIMKRCENCGYLIGENKLKGLDQKTLRKIYKLAQDFHQMNMELVISTPEEEK